MAKRTNGASAHEEEQQEEASLSPVIMDEVFTSERGWKLHIIIDISRLQDDAEKYADQLIFSRNIPFDRDVLTALDPLCIFIASSHDFEGEMVLKMAKQHYDKLFQEAYREAVMLACITHPDNVFADVPLPYDKPDTQALPGLVTLPQAEKKLTNPVERRLKLLYDRLASDPTVLGMFEVAFQRASVELTRKATQAGQAQFRSGTTG